MESNNDLAFKENFVCRKCFPGKIKEIEIFFGYFLVEWTKKIKVQNIEKDDVIYGLFNKQDFGHKAMFWMHEKPTSSPPEDDGIILSDWIETVKNNFSKSLNKLTIEDSYDLMLAAIAYGGYDYEPIIKFLNVSNGNFAFWFYDLIGKKVEFLK